MPVVFRYPAKVMSKPTLGNRFPPLARVMCASWLLAFAAAALAQQPAKPPVETQSLLSQADEILRQMSQITGLPIKGPLKKQIISRPEVAQYIEANLHEEMTPADLHAQEALLRALGVVPPAFNLEKFLVSFYTEQAAGFYDFRRKTMFIADWVPADIQTMTLAHELTHALQDQNFDLGRYMHARRDDDDATAARLAVVEGYATAAMFEQAYPGADLGQLPSLTPLMQQLIPQQIEGSPEFSNAPFFLRMQALFPYVQGVGFIQTGLQAAGWKGLNALFAQPPENTREIFAPETYFGHQSFPGISLPHPPALDGVPGLHLLYENVMGELGYYGLLGQLLSEDAAKKIGADWLADRYLLYEQAGSNGYTLVARTRWASTEGAQAFFRDYHTILIRKYPQLKTDERSDADLLVGTAANGVTLLLRRGSDCAWAEGVPADKAEAMLAWLKGVVSKQSAADRNMAPPAVISKSN